MYSQEDVLKFRIELVSFKSVMKHENGSISTKIWSPEYT
jgi:hypothetical protein